MMEKEEKNQQSLMDINECECGCSRRVSKIGIRFISGHHRRGAKLSEEQKSKISTTLTSRKLSEETKVKMRKMRHSEETKAKISKAGIGRKHTEEAKAKIGKAHKGKKMIEESKLKMSKAHKGVPLSKKHKVNIGKAGKGRKFSKESRLKISIAKLENTKSREYCYEWYDKDYVNDCRKDACEHCGMTNDESLEKWNVRLSTHHINGKKACKPNDIQTLCMSCHKKLHQKERSIKNVG